MLESLFNKVSRFQACKFIKKRLQDRCLLSCESSLLNCVPRVLKTCSRANVSCVLMCSRTNVPCVLTWQRALHVYMLTCSRVNVPCVLTCLRVNVHCVLTCSRANVPCVLTCSLASVPCVLSCQRALRANVLNRKVPCALTDNLPFVLTYRKYQQVFFSSFHPSFFVS